MMVNPKAAIKVTVDGETYYACSERCASQIRLRRGKR